jgi:hypothetical protein
MKHLANVIELKRPGSVKEEHLLKRICRTYHLRRRQKSRLTVTNALRRLFKMRGSRLGEDVALVGSLVIIHVLVKRLLILLVY